MFGGIVLNATIDRYCHATIEGRNDGRVEFHAADAQCSAELGSSANAGLEVHEAVYRRIVRDFDLGEPALSVTSVCDAPPGSGLGSSSTLVVALIEAFRQYFSLPLDDYDMARLAFEIERVDCGLAGGRQDQYAATFGGFNLMEFGADQAIVSPLRLKPAIVRELEASTILYYTGVSRESASIINEQRNHILEGEQERLEATHALRHEAMAMRDALVRGDIEELAEVMACGWAAKKQLAEGITTQLIELVFDIARSAGARAGKLSGAGGGGYILFIVDPIHRPELVRRLVAVPNGRLHPVHFVHEGATAWTVR
jgi:D-glycero-alpha-D-manno-heptose-7-phosphate kinase